MLHNVQNLKHDIIFSDSLKGHAFTFHSTWGLFSPERIDEGTRMLVESLEIPPAPYTALDLGCGYGAIGLTLAQSSPPSTVHMVDKDFVAIEYAQKNAECNHANNCRIYLSNGMSHVPPSTSFDIIVSNLPAKVSNEFYEIIFSDALQRLSRDGMLYVVTISGLREYIKRTFIRIFGNYRKVRQSARYAVAVANMKP